VTATIAASSVDKTGETLTDLLFTTATDGPSGIANGELLLAVLSSSGSSTPTITAPAGWNTARQQGVDGGVAAAVGVFWRIASSEPATYTFLSNANSATQGMTGKILRITGHDPTTPINIAGDNTTTGSDNLVVNGVTTTVNDCLMFYIVGGARSVIRTFSWPTITEAWDFGTDPGNANYMSAATKTHASAGPTGTHNAVGDAASDSLVGVCVAIAPTPSVSVPRSRLPVLGIG
jgi:hypothetical protein